MGDKIILAVTVLLTGFAVVFLVLLLLIGIIKLYGTIIYRLQSKSKEKTKVIEKVEKAVPAPAPAIAQPFAAAVNNDGEIIAVIAAAVYAAYGDTPVRIKSIRKSSSGSNAWRSAGLADNLRPF